MDYNNDGYKDVFVLRGAWAIWRNPRTGVECVIKPRLSVKFKPATRFLETLNDEKKAKKAKAKAKK